MPPSQEAAPGGAALRVLVAEDNALVRAALEKQLTLWGYHVVSVADGAAAWEVLCGADPPRLAILDWVMPGVDGLEICRRVRAAAPADPPYLILLTGRAGLDDLIAGLEGGADEYLTKPVEPAELAARMHAARRVVELQARLAERVRELEAARESERRLRGLLPICAWCKKIRNDGDYWQQVEEYLTEHADIRFSHGICPDCACAFQAEQERP